MDERRGDNIVRFPETRTQSNELGDWIEEFCFPDFTDAFLPWARNLTPNGWEQVESDIYARVVKRDPPQTPRAEQHYRLGTRSLVEYLQEIVESRFVEPEKGIIIYLEPRRLRDNLPPINA